MLQGRGFLEDSPNISTTFSMFPQITLPLSSQTGLPIAGVPHLYNRISGFYTLARTGALGMFDRGC